MEEALNNEIENTTDQDLIYVRTLVDSVLSDFNKHYEMDFTTDERNNIIIKTHRLFLKNYIAKPNSKFENAKDFYVKTIIKGCIANISAKKGVYKYIRR